MSSVPDGSSSEVALSIAYVSSYILEVVHHSELHTNGIVELGCSPE